MTFATFIAKNALRNKRRAMLSILSVAVSLFLLVILLVALREMTVPPEDISAALRIVARNRVSLANLLPARQGTVIERIPGVEVISPFTYFGGKYGKEEWSSFAQFAMDPRTLRSLFAEAKLPDDQFEAFVKDQTACIVGKLTADKYKLKLGDRMRFESTIFGCHIDLKIAGIYAGTPDDRNVLFHQKYLEEVWNAKGQVGMWWIKARSIEEMPVVIEAINKAFLNTSSEVRAETERAFQLSFVSMVGGVKIFIQSISTVVVFTLLLVSGSTMSMAIRERFREMAILKAVGFRRQDLTMLIFGESLSLALAGGCLGVGGGWLFFMHPRIAGICGGAAALACLFLAVKRIATRRWAGFAGWGIFAAFLAVLGWSVFSRGTIAQMTSNFFIKFDVTPGILAFGFGVAFTLGIASALFPQHTVAKMSVVQGLKTLD